MSAPMSHQARDLAATRAHVPHTSMFLRMLLRAAVLRRGRAASALFAMVVAAAVATAMLNLYVDVQAKLQREFRNLQQQLRKTVCSSPTTSARPCCWARA